LFVSKKSTVYTIFLLAGAARADFRRVNPLNSLRKPRAE
jgi:hypothetical protein